MIARWRTTSGWFQAGMLGGIRYWQKYNRHSQGLLLYAGHHLRIDDLTHGLNWREVENI